jgi:hypothetical protein
MGVGGWEGGGPDLCALYVKRNSNNNVRGIKIRVMDPDLDPHGSALFLEAVSDSALGGIRIRFKFINQKFSRL